MHLIKSAYTIFLYNGLLFNYSKSYWYKVWRIITVLLVFSYVIPQGMYIYYIRNDIHKLTDVLSTYVLVILTLVKMYCYSLRNANLRKLMSRIVKNYHKKTEENRLKYFLQAERRINFIAKYYYIIIMVTTMYIFSVPLIKVTYLYIIGKLRKEAWTLPFKAIFFFNAYVTPAYQLVYIVTGIATYINISTMFAIDVLYLGLCFHIEAYFKELQDKIRDLDTPTLIYDDGVSMYKETNNHKLIRLNQRTIKEKLIECITFHNEALDNISDMEGFSSPLIFTQYCGSMFLLCLIAFQTTVVKNENTSIISFIGFGVSETIELFFWSWGGSTIIHSSQKIGETIYMTSWYRHSPQIRYYLHFILMRAQNTKCLTVLKFTSCSYESFRKVLSTSLSMLALLQSVQEKLIK